ncbi:MAG: hypothetical protein AAGJ52_02270 [Pseudomonadota bacterium]
MGRINALIISAVIVCASSLATAEDRCNVGDLTGPPSVEAWPAEKPLPVDAIPMEQWFVHGPDWIVAPDVCVASTVARELDAARSMFDARFQAPTTRGAVVSVRYATQMAALRAAGVDWVLPWRFPELTADVDPVRAALEEQIRGQIEAQLSTRGQTPDPTRVDALLAQALAQLDEQRSVSDSSESSSTTGKRMDAIRHEIAHLLFMRELWPSTSNGAQQYGGDAPDWLDETAAVLAESESMTRDRRAALIDAVGAETLLPLAEYLSMPHPSFGDGAFAAMIEEARANADDTGVIFITTEDSDARIDDAALFYTQTRAWIDFLTERSGERQVFAHITEALKAGASFEGWLLAEGPDLGLPAQLPLLEAEFLAWARAAAQADA